MSAAPQLRAPWPKGVSGNPSGKTKLPEGLRDIKSLTQLEVAKLISKYARFTKEELQAFLKQPGATALDLAIASILARAIQFGDYGRLNALLNRAIGQAPVIPDEVDPDGELGKLSDEELAARIRRFLPRLEKGA